MRFGVVILKLFLDVVVCEGWFVDSWSRKDLCEDDLTFRRGSCLYVLWSYSLVAGFKRTKSTGFDHSIWIYDVFLAPLHFHQLTTPHQIG